uniref:Solute carrier family 35 member F1 n=1 Tax=Plectus sambesii TaxID=2011161 RepID=A0A914X0A6_9BILA
MNRSTATTAAAAEARTLRDERRRLLQKAPTFVMDEVEEGIECSPCCQNKKCRRTVVSLLLGQVLSICLCGTGVSSQFLSSDGVNTPTSQTFINYFFLCFVYGTLLSCKSGENGLLTVFRKRGWQYFLLALFDVEANFLLVYAYQYTNLTSIQLLDCFTIPVVLVLSWMFLSVRYLISHIIGVVICLIGIACLIWADVLEGKSDNEASDRVKGDILCLSGALLYGLSNTAEEFFVKQHNRIEYLGMIGLFGSFISGIQLAIFEHNELAKVTWTWRVISMYLLYALCMFVFYSMVTVVMQRSSALLFNLSILTADFYTLLFGLFLFKYTFHLLYFVSFIVVVGGSAIYMLRETHKRDPDESHCAPFCCTSCCCCSSGSDAGSFDVDNRVVEENQPIGAVTQMRYCPV